MADPAVEAAQRAIPVPPPSWMLEDGVIDGLSDYGIAAARGALKPIRELHQSTVMETPYDRWLGCNGCGGDWPCETARLVYSSEELDRD